MKRILLICLIILNCVFVVLLLATVRQLRSGSSQSVKWRKLEAENQRLENMVKVFDEQKLLEEHRTFMKRVLHNSRVPLPAMKAMLELARHEKIASINFTFDEKTVQTLSGMDNMSIISFGVTMKCSYDSLLRFLHRLPENEVLITIGNILIEREGESPIVKVRIAVNAYSQMAVAP